jgi:hypothetical protein
MSALTQDPQHPDQWIVPAVYRRGTCIQQATIIRGVHLEAECWGQQCIIHNPSHHHMRRWPLLYDTHLQIFLRMCRHGISHPDPDTWGEEVHPHGDDGCCQQQ